MKRMRKPPLQSDSPTARASLGGKVSHYRGKQNIYSQGTPAYTLFYIQEGGVRLITRSKHQPSAVTAILGVGDFFGELCLAGFPLRMSTAVALTASSVREIKKESMLRILRKRNKISHSFVSYLARRRIASSLMMVQTELCTLIQFLERNCLKTLEVVSRVLPMN
jgi:CRP-like cAMP-binding protein